MKDKFTTVTGYEVQVMGIPQGMFDVIRKSSVFPEKPTYEIVTASGAIEKHALSPDTLEDPEDPTKTEVNKRLWAAYTDEYALADSRMKEMVTRAIFMKGIKVEGEPTDEWKDMQNFIGIKLPANPLELRMQWIITEVFSDPNDTMLALNKVMQAMGVPEEALVEAQNSFRNTVEKQSATGKPRSRKRKLES